VDVQTALEIVKLVGVPTMLMLFYGPPVLLVAYFLIKDWNFTERVIEVMTKIEVLIEARDK
jgi:hypothetical protein